LPFEDNTFDFILCNHVLEHINDDIKAIKELYRVMKPGGSGVFQIPLNNKLKITFSDDSIINKNERSKIFGQYDHVRVYGMDYFDKLKSCGFRVKKINYTSKLSNEEIQKYCLSYGELIPFVEKPNKS
jgi:ubiquinone/menaquinone biosynthesis C-methylase UbiE